MVAVALVEVAFAGVGDIPPVRGDQTPTPLVVRVTVLDERGFRLLSK